MSEPKFRPGDTIIIYGNTEEEFVIRHVWSNIRSLRLEDGPVVDMSLCKVVFSPASREETEALRRVAKAAQRHNDARHAWANAAIVDDVYGTLCEDVASASDELVEALDAWKDVTSDTTDCAGEQNPLPR